MPGRILLSLLFCFCALPMNELAAQVRTKTSVRVEILINDGVGLSAQEWSKVFAGIGRSVRIRSPLLDDKAEIKEVTQGTLRMVTVIGELSRDGLLVFPGKVFSMRDGKKLDEWLKELETYGAQGAPDGKPLWGLNESQFTGVYNALSEKLEVETQGKALAELLPQFKFPKEYPVRVSTNSSEWVKNEFKEFFPVRQELKGFSKGTALAIILNDYGLGFRPLRTPSGSLELVTDPLQTTQQVWPIGWDLKESRQKTAPKLFELVPVELKNVALLDVLHAVAVRVEIPILIDFYRVEGKGIDITNLKVSHPQKQTSWSLVLRGVTNPNKMTRRILVDELGQPFIWITTLEPGKPADQ